MELTDDNYDDIIGHKKYALVEFYTKWCRFCKMLSPEYDEINKKTELTDKSEYIKENFFDLKRRLDEIYKKIEINNNSKPNKNKKYKKLRIVFDFTLVNIFVTGITLLIIFAFYQTGRKLLINLKEK